MPEPLNQGAIAAWRRNWGERCPYCDGAFSDMEVGPVEREPRPDDRPDDLYMYERCSHCGKRWITVARREYMPLTIEELPDE